MKLLFTSPVLEFPAAGGPQLRILNSIKVLHRLTELTVVPRISVARMGGAKAEAEIRSICRNFAYAPSSQDFSSGAIKQRLQRFWRAYGNADRDFLLDVIDREGIEAIWFGYGNISWPLIRKLKRARPELKVICDTDSVWSRYVLRELPYERSPWRRLKIRLQGWDKARQEKAWVDLCDVTTAVSEFDAEYYRGIARDPSRIKVFSNVIDLDTYKDKSLAPADFRRPSIYLAGSFWAKSPMEKAARWMLDDVLPLIRQQLPDLHFYILGNASKEILADVKDPGVSIVGRVDSVLPYLQNVDVSLVPLQFESGTRFKILESGACRVPIVSTTLGAEGLNVAQGKDILLADEPQAFADAIVSVVRDKNLAARLAEGCYAVVRSKYSLEYAETEAKNILETIQRD